jgi:hypothetical protein
MLLIELPLRRRIGRLKDLPMPTGRSLVYRLVYNGDPRRRIVITSVRQLSGTGRAHI